MAITCAGLPRMRVGWAVSPFNFEGKNHFSRKYGDGLFLNGGILYPKLNGEDIQSEPPDIALAGVPVRIEGIA
ncbi:hypothetical protein JCM12296A_42390 [Desulfosarcina cetonica]